MAYSYMLLRNFFGRKKGDLFLGGSIDVQPNPRALEPFPKQRKMNPGDKLDISKWGNILFQNAFSFSSGIMNIWDTRNKEIGTLVDKQALDDGLIEVFGFKNIFGPPLLKTFNVQPDKLGQVPGAIFRFAPPPNRKVTHLQYDGEPIAIPGPFSVVISGLRPVKFLFFDESPVKDLTNVKEINQAYDGYAPLQG